MTKDASSLRNRRILYGRRSGRALTSRRKTLYETLLPHLTLALDRLSNPQSVFNHPIDDLWLEVGFGGGEHLAAQAAANSNVGFIGCEPFIEGVARLVEHIDARNLKNVRIHPDDARDVIDRLPDASLGRVFVLFPDPWPKARHWKRRFINPENLVALARVMRKGAELRLASDQPDYITWSKDQIAQNKHFVLKGDEAVRPADWPTTRYEQKGLKAGSPCRYLTIGRR
jgi:tRNA (guanine-N7-)-methyltransferase